MSAKDILCTYFYTNNFNRFEVITLTISNYGETWGGYFKTNNMKLYTEKELIKAMDGFYDSDCTMQDVIDRLTPIELPSDEEIEVIALNMISNLKDKLESREEAFYLGGFQTCINWMKEQILNQNK